MTEEQVVAFVSARLDRREVSLVDDHMRRCVSCTALVVEALRARGAARDQRAPTLGARCAAFEPHARVADRYVVRRCIGHGGMSDVYEAFDGVLGARVALKMARAAVCDHPGVTARLVSEVKLARRVSHRSICRVHDIGVHRDERPSDARTAFISMEYIDGESLAQRLARGGALSPDEFRSICPELLRAIAAVHRANVIHRDIKSHNIMLRRAAGTSPIVLIDFGLAIDARHAAQVPAPSGVAGPPSVEGSPAYMAPEQFASLSSPASDVFGCGVVLFEALTGALPFRQLGPQRKAGARRDPREVPLRAAELVSSVPAALDAFLARCLDVVPERRYPCAEEALADLERALLP